MKRINLSVDIESNELLGKTIEEAIYNRAKEIARESYDKVLHKEIDRIAKAKVDEALKKYGYNSIANNVAKSMSDEINRKLNEVDFIKEVDSLIIQETEKALTKRISEKGDFNWVIQKYIDNAVARIISSPR